MTSRHNQIQGFESPNWRLFQAIHQASDALNYRLLNLFAWYFPLMLLFLIIEAVVTTGATHCSVLYLVNLCVKLADVYPATLLTRNINSVNDLVYSISKADIRLNRLIQCNGSYQIMGLNNLLIVVTQADACQTEEGLIAGMFWPDVNCFIA